MVPTQVRCDAINTKKHGAVGSDTKCLHYLRETGPLQSLVCRDIENNETSLCRRPRHAVLLYTMSHTTAVVVALLPQYTFRALKAL